MCLVDITLNGKSRFILGCVYIHPNVSISDLEMFFFAMLKYSKNAKKISKNMIVDTEVPMIIMGDFNIDAQTNLHALDFMKTQLNLDFVPTRSPTLGNTYINLTFARNISVDLMPYVSSFSYHRLIVNKTILSLE